MATSWREPECPACRIDFHRIRTGPERGLGIYTKCWSCEAKDAAVAAIEKAAVRRSAIVSESERHWRELRRRERSQALAEELGDEGPLPNPRRSSRLYWNRSDWSPSALGDWSITYLGAGVITNEAGAFQAGTTASVSEELALGLAKDHAWLVSDPDGTVVSQQPMPATVPASEIVRLRPERRRRGRVSGDEYRKALLEVGVGLKLSTSAASVLCSLDDRDCSTRLLSLGLFRSQGGWVLVLPTDRAAMEAVEAALWDLANDHPELHRVACSVARLASTVSHKKQNPIVVASTRRPSRCPWCHDDLSGYTMTCARCDGVYHAACVEDNAGICSMCSKSLLDPEGPPSRLEFRDEAGYLRHMASERALERAELEQRELADHLRHAAAERARERADEQRRFPVITSGSGNVHGFEIKLSGLDDVLELASRKSQVVAKLGRIDGELDVVIVPDDRDVVLELVAVLSEIAESMSVGGLARVRARGLLRELHKSVGP